MCAKTRFMQDEYEISRIPKSQHLHFLSDEEKIRIFLANNDLYNSTVDEKFDVVCYCSLGYRSAVLVRKINEIVQSDGIGNVETYNLEGSIFKWANEDRPLVNSENLSSVHVHPFSTLWGFLGKYGMRNYC